jgi:hypothetical protein
MAPATTHHQGHFRRQGRRNLRFFDPDHRTCGSLIEEHAFDPRKLQHHFATACMFGAKEREYYLQTTVTTDVELEPNDKHRMNQILQALSHVAKKTKRAIRINMKIQRGYNHEHIQPYSLVNVVALDKIGVNVVEPGYWRRAVVAQKIQGVRDLTTATLTWDQALLDSSDADEIILSLKEILDLDNALVGTMVGPEGGYDHGDWVQPFACMKEHPNPVAIAPQNDPLSPP